MQRKRAGLVPIGEVFGSLDGPIQAIRKTLPPARRGFTVADQVNQLVGASEADPNLGFMGRTMPLCSLPRSNPGNRKEYKHVNGPFTLYMVAGGGNKLPLRQLTPFVVGLGLDRSGTDPKPRAGSGSFAGRVHANARHLPQQRRTRWRLNAAPQPNGSAL